MHETIKKIVVVVGCQRSGTTLTAQILGAHENALMIDEYDGLYAWFDTWVDVELGGAPQLEHSILVKAAAKYRAPENMIESHGKSISAHPRIDTLVLKAPNLTFDAATLTCLQTDVFVVYPVRDPRAVVASMMRLSNINFVENQIRRLEGHQEIAGLFPEAYQILTDSTQPNWLRAAMVWKIKSNLMDEYVKRELPVFRFRYEDLVSTPRSLISDLLSFCGLRNMEEPYLHGSIYQGFGPGETDRTRSIDLASIENWQTALDLDTAGRIIQACNPQAETFGYE